jgi:hypothetical protein
VWWWSSSSSDGAPLLTAAKARSDYCQTNIYQNHCRADGNVDELQLPYMLQRHIVKTSQGCSLTRWGGSMTLSVGGPLASHWAPLGVNTATL